MDNSIFSCFFCILEVNNEKESTLWLELTSLSHLMHYSFTITGDYFAMEYEMQSVLFMNM